MQIDLSSRGLHAFSPGELSSQVGAEATPVQVTGLNLARNSLGSVHGLQGFTHLTVLDLSFNGLASLDGGLPLQLVSLNVAHNSLSTLQGGALLPLRQLEELNVACNRLVDLRGVSSGGGSATLRFLDASGNQLSSLNGIERCSALEELHVECNLIKEAANVASVRQLPRLRSFLIKENPLLLRKRQARALFSLLPQSVQYVDAPAPSSAPSTNTSTVSASTAATAVEVEELRRSSANTSRETAWQQQQHLANASRGSPHGGRTRLGGIPEQHQRHHMDTPHRDPSSLSPRPGNGNGSAWRGQQHPSQGTSPLGGVGGKATSPICPRKSLPSTPPPVPPLQPYDVPAPGTTPPGSHQQPAPAPASSIAAHMLRSALVERVVGADAPPLAGPRGPARGGGASPGSQQVPAASRRSAPALEDLVEERDAYKRQVAELTEELAQLQRAMLLERENTAVVLCINEQLQKRLEQALAGGNKEGSGQQATAPTSMPPLAPPPATLLPRAAASRSLPAGGPPCPYPAGTTIETVDMDITMDLPAATVATAAAVEAPLAPRPDTGSEDADSGPAQQSSRRAESLVARRRAAAALMAKLRPAAVAHES